MEWTFKSEDLKEQGGKMKSEKVQPEKKFNAGAISVSVWKNQTKDKDREFFTISFDRKYKDQDGTWKNSNSLRLNDLPKATFALQQAYEYLLTAPKGAAEEMIY